MDKQQQQQQQQQQIQSQSQKQLQPQQFQISQQQQQQQQGQGNKPVSPNKQTSSAINLTAGLDYKELQKTLVNFQKAQMQLERTGKLSPIKAISSLKSKEMINFKALENAGLINLNLPTEKKKVEGVKISLEDIEKAFKILDEKNGGQKISLNELKRKIPQINPNFPLNEIPALTQGKAEMKSKELYELLKQNELEQFDPLLEAYNLLDPKGEGHIDIKRLESVFNVLGYASLDQKDQDILLECLGHNGQITLQDLREIFENENI